MKVIFLFVLSSIAVTSISAQEVKTTNFRVQDEFYKSLDDQEYDKKNITIVAENGDKYFKSLESIEAELNQGMKLYKDGSYEKAYTILSELSQWGIKDAQAILGNMFLKGEHVDKSVERGLAWLGVAKEDGMQKSAVESFDYIYQQLSAEHQTYMDQKIVAYIEKYGAEAQNFQCKSRQVIGSNLRENSCLKVAGSSSKLYPIE